MKRLRTTAAVELKVAVRDVGAWMPGCTVEQVRGQAEEAARQRLGRALRDDPSISIIGEAKVTVVTVQEESS